MASKWAGLSSSMAASLAPPPPGMASWRWPAVDRMQALTTRVLQCACRVRTATMADNEATGVARPVAPYRRQRLLDTPDARRSAVAAGAGTHVGGRGDSRRPTGGYVGVCLSAAHALE